MGVLGGIVSFLRRIAQWLEDRGLEDRSGKPREAAAPNSPGDAVRDLAARLDQTSPPRRRANWVLRIVLAGLVLTIGAPLFFVGAWRFIDPPFTWLMVERLGEGEKLTRKAVSLDDISPNLVRAVIAAEDARFCAHDGFDIEAIQKALANNSKGRKIRGGSTISQQTAKNVFLWAERSWVRKGLEAYFTVLIEATWPKRRIMEAYLNVVEWGDGRFGAEAAAQQLFGKSAKDLTAKEAARLAAVLPSPNKWRADSPGPYVRRRAGTIISRMAVVRNERLDACVLDPSAPAPVEAPAKGRDRPAPMPDLAPLPPPPEQGPESDPLADTPQLELAPVEGGVEPIAPVGDPVEDGLRLEPSASENDAVEAAPAPQAEPAPPPADAPVDLRPPG